MDQPSGYLDALFDFSFTEFITTKMIKILYGLGILLAALGTLGLIVRGFTDSFGKGILFLMISPVVFIIYVIIARVILEVVTVLFRISEHLGEIAQNLKK